MRGSNGKNMYFCVELCCLFCDLKIAQSVSIHFVMCFYKTNLTCLHTDTPVISRTCCEQIHESGCQVPSAIPAESNSKSRLKPCARFWRRVWSALRFFWDFFFFNLFIRPQTNRMQVHQIINSSDSPASSLKHFPS